MMVLLVLNKIFAYLARGCQIPTGSFQNFVGRLLSNIYFRKLNQKFCYTHHQEKGIEKTLSFRISVFTFYNAG